MASSECNVSKTSSKVAIKALAPQPLPKPSSVIQKTYNARAGKPKVRTGCRVCKMRHVKCDETKPECLKCISTGRKCEGYDLAQSKIASHRSTLESPKASDSGLTLYQVSPTFTGNHQEHRSFSYFQSQSLSEILDVFSSGFWDGLVLQASQSEPIVRHAVLALSATYEDYRIDGLEFLKQSPKSFEPASETFLIQRTKVALRDLSKFASQQYDMAVKLLVEMKSPPLNVTLMTCLIFICLEYLRNNFDVGLTHLKSGLKILADAKKSSLSPIETSLSNFFTRLDIQATIHGSATSDFNAGAPVLHWNGACCGSNSFSRFEDPSITLTNALMLEVCAIFNFIRHREDPNYLHTTASENCDSESDFRTTFTIESRCAFHLRNLETWQSAFSSYLRSVKICPQPLTSIVQVWHLLVTLQLRCLFLTSELMYDNFNAEFSHAIDLLTSVILGQKVISQNQSSTDFCYLSFDIGVLTPLFFVALKCRHLPTRLKALELLKHAPEREGMWLRDPIIEYVELKITEEEKGRGDLRPGDSLPSEARIRGEVLIWREIDGQKVSKWLFQRAGVWEEITTNWTPLMGDVI